MKWSKEADEQLSKVPFFVRKRVKKRVEEESKSQGADIVSAEHVSSMRNRYLNKMEDEVKGYQVETCFGSGDCPNNVADTSGLAEKTEKILSAENMKDFLKKKVKGPLKFHHEFRVSMSGCPNACSRPQIADIGIIGVCTPEFNRENCNRCGECLMTCKEEAISIPSSIPKIDKSKCLLCGQCVKACSQGAMEEGITGYKILVGGKLGRHPRLAIETPGVFKMEETVDIISRLITYYKENGVEGERFGELLENKQIFDLDQGVSFLDNILY